MLFGTFTVQEEVGLRGAKTSSYVVDPEIVLLLIQDLQMMYLVVNQVSNLLGKGPQILLYDGGLSSSSSFKKICNRSC
jgi:putative aminopeptidase FrvX